MIVVAAAADSDEAGIGIEFRLDPFSSSMALDLSPARGSIY
jgi:hypothetical protein